MENALAPVKTCPSGYMHCRFRLLVFTHDTARGTNDFLWGIFSLQNLTVQAGFRSRNPTVRAGSASQLKRGTVVGRTDRHHCCNYI